MKRTIYLTFASVLGTLSALAQEPRQVVVTRDYQPDVSTFQKLDFAPRDLDTAALEPDVEYSVVPVKMAIVTPLHITEPPRMDIARREIFYPLYVRAGIGAPISSLLDFYATHISDKRTLVAYINHDGVYTSVTNDAGEDGRAMTMHNAIGGYIWQRFGNGSHLTASLDYRDNLYDAYGGYTPLNILPEAGEHTLHYGDLSARVEYKGATEKFDYRISGTAGYFFGADNLSLGYIDIEGAVGFGLGIGKLNIGLPIGYEGGANSDLRIGVVPSYKFKVLDRVDLNVGAQLLYNNHKDLANRAYFYPIVEAGMTMDNIRLYASWTGELGHTSVRALTQQNPYLNSVGLSVGNPSVNRLKAGFYGNAAQMVTYNVFGGADIWRDYTYFVAYPSGLFQVRSADVVNNYYVGAAVAVQPFAGLDISARWRGNFFDPMPETGVAIPRWEAGLKVGYSYQNRFYARLGADLLGERRFATADSAAGEGIDIIPTSINLSAEFEARISRTVNVFLRGDNLLNKRFELYDHYFVPGISVMAGVKVVF